MARWSLPKDNDYKKDWVKFDGKPGSYRDPYNYEKIERDMRGDDDYYGYNGTGEGNEDSIDYLNPLFEYSPGRVNDVARNLGISNIDSEEESNDILRELQRDAVNTNLGSDKDRDRDRDKFKAPEIKAPYQPTDFWENVVSDPSFQRYGETDDYRNPSYGSNRYDRDEQDKSTAFKNKYMTDLTEGLNITERNTLNLDNAMAAIGLEEKRGHTNYLSKFKKPTDA